MRPLTAIGLFTLIPVPARELDRRAAAGAMASLPLIGLLLGVLAGVFVWGGATIGTPWLGAVAGLGVLAGLTGGLHLDGVADTADGLGSRKPAKEALAIMKRSDIGPMGVIALVLVLLFQCAAIMDLASGFDPLQAGAAVAIAAATGRASCLFASRGPSARPGGFGALMAGAPSRIAVALNAIAVVALGMGLGWWAAGPFSAVALSAAVAVALGVGFGWGRHVTTRLGGTTGDVYGSIVEVTQTAALIALALGVHLSV